MKALITVPLYKYKGKNGELITTINLGIEHEPMVRLVADAGSYLTNGEIKTGAIDITEDQVDLWSEKPYEDNEDVIEVNTFEEVEE